MPILWIWDAWPAVKQSRPPCPACVWLCGDSNHKPPHGQPPKNQSCRMLNIFQTSFYFNHEHGHTGGENLRCHAVVRGNMKQRNLKSLGADNKQFLFSFFSSPFIQSKGELMWMFTWSVFMRFTLALFCLALFCLVFSYPARITLHCLHCLQSLMSSATIQSGWKNREHKLGYVPLGQLKSHRHDICPMFYTSLFSII